ncbi:hypothetical protein E4T56_gene1146 [Termitomyces sp. T112]|nr:hypothetical protein E4T56_gene1146 [Termitomyces sp. T112]
MAPESSSTVLPSDSTNPSVPECIIHHRWEGSKYARVDRNFTQWTEKLKDALILNGIYSHVFDTIAIRPNIDTEPQAHANWGLNDQLTIIFMKSALDDAEHCDLITNKGMACTTMTPSPKSFVAVTGADGKMWYVDPSQLEEPPAPETAAIAKVNISLSESPLDYSTEYW